MSIPTGDFSIAAALCFGHISNAEAQKLIDDRRLKVTLSKFNLKSGEREVPGVVISDDRKH